VGHRHRAAFALGLTLAVLNLLPPVIAVADQRMLFHIAQEMLLLALVVPLIALATPAIAATQMNYCPHSHSTSVSAARR